MQRARTALYSLNYRFATAAGVKTCGGCFLLAILLYTTIVVTFFKQTFGYPLHFENGHARM